MKTSLTIFKNIYDVKTNRRIEFSHFSEFEILLKKLSQEKIFRKNDAALISPAKYIEGMTRKNKNVICWDGWCVVDVDNVDFDGDIVDILYKKYGQYNYICYSTASSSTRKPKFRMIFPLTDIVKSDKIKHFWHALAQELDGIVDIQTKDFSRMFYIPGDYSTASNQFFFSNWKGFNIDPMEIMNKHEPPKEMTGNSFFDKLPENVQNEIIEHRKSKSTNRDIFWNSYADCKFWPRKLAKEYSEISDGGWYHKLYTIMCAIASNAIRNKYPITASEIAMLCKQFDTDNGLWYKDRPLLTEANRAIEFVYRNSHNV